MFSFARGRRRPFGHWRWLAAVPILATALFVFDAPAPAEVGDTPTAQIASAQQAQPRWSRSNARALLAAIDAADAEGLNPADYSADVLRSALDGNQKGPALDAIANAAALRLAHDYANGRIDDKDAYDWHLGNRADTNALAAGLNDALDSDRLAKWLKSLLPDSEQYKALKAAYADTDRSDAHARAVLRANLERWRWMPRDLGERYLYVNVPSLSARADRQGRAGSELCRRGRRAENADAAARADGAIGGRQSELDPAAERDEGRHLAQQGLHRDENLGRLTASSQAPGPNNALGRIKIDMPNEHAIYLHDTPNKAAFNRSQRALSHGCVRVQNIADLAAQLSDSDQLDAALEIRIRPGSCRWRRAFRSTSSISPPRRTPTERSACCPILTDAIPG